MEESQVKRRRRSKKTCTQKTWKTFSSYSSESTIHSMNYIGKENLHWIERVFWITAFFTAFSFCSFFIYQTYQKWENDPMIVSLKEKATPTWQIPFPAITICSESKIDVEKFNLKDILDKIDKNQKLTQEETLRYEAAYQVCELFVVNSNETDGNIYKALWDISIDFSNISEVSAINLDYPFSEEFHQVVTRNGICYTSNMLHYKDLFTNQLSPYLRYPRTVRRSNWSTTAGYDNDEPFTYPQRVFGSGKEADMKVTLKILNKKVSNTCSSAAKSFRLTIHSPDELPQTNSNFFRIPFNMETLITIDPKVTSTEKELKSYKPEKRQCYFPGEKKLEFFKVYSESNCKIESLTKYVLEKCGCVRFSMPHKLGTRICTRSELPCLKKAQTISIILDLADAAKGGSETFMEFKKDLAEFKSNFTKNSTQGFYGNYSYENGGEDDEESFNDKFEFETTNVKCLPACSSIVYAAEISQTTIDRHEYLKDNKVDSDDEKISTAIVSIYFKEAYFIEAKRSELFGLTNFLSSCGGFLGLLMGGSFLSLLEILYHFVIKKIFHKEVEEDNTECEGRLLKK